MTKLLSGLLTIFVVNNVSAVEVDPISIRTELSKIDKKILLVKNNKDVEEYVQITIKKYINPGTEEEELVDVDSKEFDVYPRQFRNIAGQKRRVHLLYGGETIENEVVYQIMVEDVAKNVASAGKSVMFTNIRYAVNLFLVPEKKVYSFEHIELDSARYLKNNGNVRIHILETGCVEGDFSSVVKYRIYPGQEKRLDECVNGKRVINNEFGKLITQ